MSGREAQPGKRPLREAQRTDQRVMIVRGAAVLWAVVVVLRLIQLQVVEHESWLKRAREQQEAVVPIPALRGQIEDRNGERLAVTVARYAVVLDPTIFPIGEAAKKLDKEYYRQGDEAVRLLASGLGLDPQALLRRIERERERNSKYLLVARQVPVETWHQLREELKKHKVRAVATVNDYVREYPKGRLAAHVLGGLKGYDLRSEDSEAEETCEQSLVRRDRKRTPAEVEELCNAGRGGLEYSLNAELKGRTGSGRLLKVASDMPLDFTVVQEPVPGTALTLTLDAEIQHEAERQLELHVQDQGAAAGTAVVMNPNTGEVLALAQYPTFDPNEKPTDAKALDARVPRAIAWPYEPGSVWKIMTYAAALDAGVLQTHQTVGAPKGNYRRVSDEHGGLAKVPVAFALSSNIGAIDVGFRLGKAAFWRSIKDLGMGQRTGIEMPGEAPGVIKPHGEWVTVRDAGTKQPKRVWSQWSDSTLTSISFGHELMVTTLQLAQLTSVMANGGYQVRPHLVKKRTREGSAVTVPVERRRVLKGSTAAEMRHLMRLVVTDGTAKRLDMGGYTAGGKTGTAMRPGKKGGGYVSIYNASFAGFAPVGRPELVTAVTLFETRGSRGYGAGAAVPVFEKVMKTALRVLQVREDRGEADPASGDLKVAKVEPKVAAVPLVQDAAMVRPLPPVRTAGARRVVDLRGLPAPDFRGKSLREVLELAAERGVRVVAKGRGLARVQAPAAGQWMPEGGDVVVQMGNLP